MQDSREQFPPAPGYGPTPSSYRNRIPQQEMALQHVPMQMRDQHNTVNHAHYYVPGAAPQMQHDQFYHPLQNMQSTHYRPMELQPQQFEQFPNHHSHYGFTGMAPPTHNQQFYQPQQNMQGLVYGPTDNRSGHIQQDANYRPQNLMAAMPTDRQMHDQRFFQPYQKMPESEYGRMETESQQMNPFPILQPQKTMAATPTAVPQDVLARVYENLTPALRKQHHQAFGRTRPESSQLESSYCLDPSPQPRQASLPLPNHVSTAIATPTITIPQQPANIHTQYMETQPMPQDLVLTATPTVEIAHAATNASTQNPKPVGPMNPQLFFQAKPKFQRTAKLKNSSIEHSIVVLRTYFTNDPLLVQKLMFFIHDYKFTLTPPDLKESRNHFRNKPWNHQDVVSTLDRLGINVPMIPAHLQNPDFKKTISEVAFLRFCSDLEWDEIAQIINFRNKMRVFYTAAEWFSLFQVLFHCNCPSIRGVYEMVLNSDQVDYLRIQDLFAGDHGINVVGRFQHFSNFTTVKPQTLSSISVSRPASSQPTISQPPVAQVAVSQPSLTPPIEMPQTHIDLTMADEDGDIQMAIDTVPSLSTGPSSMDTSPISTPPQASPPSTLQTSPTTATARRPYTKRSRKDLDDAGSPDIRPRRAKRRRRSPTPKPSRRKLKNWEKRIQTTPEREQSRATATFFARRGKTYAWMKPAEPKTILDPALEERLNKEAETQNLQPVATTPALAPGPDKPTKSTTKKPKKGTNGDLPKRGRPRKNATVVAVEPREATPEIAASESTLVMDFGEEDAPYDNDDYDPLFDEEDDSSSSALAPLDNNDDYDMAADLLAHLLAADEDTQATAVPSSMPTPPTQQELEDKELLELNWRLPVPVSRRKEGMEYNWMGYERKKVALKDQKPGLYYDPDGYEKFVVPDWARRGHRVYDEDGREESDMDEAD